MSDDYQRMRAIDVLLIETEVDEERIEEYDTWQLDVWLNELGYEWDEDAGCYVFVDD